MFLFLKPTHQSNQSPAAASPASEEFQMWGKKESSVLVPDALQTARNSREKRKMHSSMQVFKRGFPFVAATGPPASRRGRRAESGMQPQDNRASRWVPRTAAVLTSRSLLTPARISTSKAPTGGRRWLLAAASAERGKKTPTRVVRAASARPVWVTQLDHLTSPPAFPQPPARRSATLFCLGRSLTNQRYGVAAHTT